MSEAAVYIRNACKSYDQFKPVLKDFFMTVPRGTIYGLLGASGCGKTTLLSCIVGRSNLNSGEIWVLGGKPGMVGSGVPGPAVGFMPQEIALCDEFTSKEAIVFFGRLMNMDEELIEARCQNLKELLELPPDSRYVKDCSGGQKRRISLACALIHNPELLILDEPTAGVDPLLRDRIWQFLREMTLKEKTTVIITTHYIEETRQADLIGLMREGKLLAEASPNTLLQSFEAETLEDVFLFLSEKQEEKSSGVSVNELQRKGSLRMENLPRGEDLENILFSQNYTGEQPVSRKSFESRNTFDIKGFRMKALLLKNWKQFYRNVSGWVFLLGVLPIICAMCFLHAIGVKITNSNIAIVNDDSSCDRFSLTESATPIENGSCQLENLGCRFSRYIEKDPFFTTVPVNNLSDGLNAIVRGEYGTLLQFRNNYSLATQKRLILGKSAEDSVIDLSRMNVFMDMSDFVISLTMQKELLNIFQKYINDIFDDCRYMNFINKTISFQMIHGDGNGSFTDYMLPTYYIISLSYFATMLTSSIIISERLGGVWDRSAVAGVSVVEIILSHFLIQFCVMFVQGLESYVLFFIIYDMPNFGSVISTAVMTILQGISGICYGFLVSVASYDNYFGANIMIAGGFYPMILISGAVWPLEGQPVFLQWISKMTPFTIPSLAFKNIMLKGWGLTHPGVYAGVGVALTWILIFISCSIFLLRKKQ